jgi:hypothetical protein
VGEGLIHYSVAQTALHCCIGSLKGHGVCWFIFRNVTREVLIHPTSIASPRGLNAQSFLGARSIGSQELDERAESISSSDGTRLSHELMLSASRARANRASPPAASEGPTKVQRGQHLVQAIGNATSEWPHSTHPTRDPTLTDVCSTGGSF